MTNVGAGFMPARIGVGPVRAGVNPAFAAFIS